MLKMRQKFLRRRMTATADINQSALTTRDLLSSPTSGKFALFLPNRWRFTALLPVRFFCEIHSHRRKGFHLDNCSTLQLF